MATRNRVWDTQVPGFVAWDTAAPDPSGNNYPGPGTFGVHTSDYVIGLQDAKELPLDGYRNRVWDTIAGGFVSWSTASPDTGGANYPGPGTFGVHTSDFCVIGEGEPATGSVEPDQLPNLTFWGRFDDTVNDGTNVETLNAKAGTGSPFSESSTLIQPFLTTVGSPSREAGRFWDGTTNYDWLRGGAESQYITASDYHVFCVFRVESVSLNIGSLWLNHRIMGDGPGWWGLYARNNGGTPEVYSYHWDGSAKIIPFTINLNQTYLIEWWYDGVDVHARLDDGAISTIAAGSVGSVSSILDLGSSGTQRLEGYILDIALANANSEGQGIVNDIRNGFSTRYGMSV